MWQYYTSNQLQVTVAQETFTGKVENNVFTFTKTDSPDVKFTIGYPKSWEVFECSGVFNTGNETEKAIQAQIGAMFNRHMLENPANSCKADEFYKKAPANYYAQFWHPNSIENKAYGFSYDDACDQSTLLKDPKPQKLKVTISWD